jgi:hypothetical protein
MFVVVVWAIFLLAPDSESRESSEANQVRSLGKSTEARAHFSGHGWHQVGRTRWTG